MEEEFEIPRVAVYVFVVLAAAFMIYQLSPFWLKYVEASPLTSHTTEIDADVSDGGALNLQAIADQVNPKEGITVDVVWWNVVQEMIKSGALDPDKLRLTLAGRYGQQLTPEMERILTTPNLNEKLRIGNDNAVFMMYVLGILAKRTNNPILHSSPWQIPNIFSDASANGWGDLDLIKLTPEQQAIAEYVANNAYRPCCGQPAAKPECTHGFSLLGLIYLMAEQGFTKEEIFKASVAFNSHWYPSNYVFNAIYFKATEGRDWNDVDAELVMSRDYSSITGAMKVQSYLKSAGII